MKVLIVGDTHLSDKRISSRIDDYSIAGLLELEEILEIGTENQVDAVICLGDFFDRLEIGNKYTNDIIQLLAKYKTLRKISLIGNHDIHHNHEFYDKSSLRTLILTGVLENPLYCDHLMMDFHNFTHDLDAKLETGYLLNFTRPIQVLHASIVNGPIMGHYILFNELKMNEKIKFVFSGHIHKPMSLKHDGRVFINPGNVGRNQASSGNINREIKVLLFEYNSDLSKIKYTPIKLKSSKPANEIFNLDKIQEIKNKKNAVMNFVNMIKQNNINSSSLDEELMLIESAKSKNIDDETIEYILQLVRGDIKLND